MCLLGFAPLLNEEDVGADSKVEFVVFVLSVFVRTLSNVALVNRDNVSTKIKIARIFGKPSSDVLRNRLNLALEKYLEDYEQIIVKVNHHLKTFCTL